MFDIDERRTEQADAFDNSMESIKRDECADIEDPFRKGLCRVCQMPIIGAAPFCRDHEAPIP